MSNQFKVGDTVRFTDEAYRRLKVDECQGREMLVTEILEGGTMLCFINPATELEMRVHERWLEIATPPDLKAEKAALLSRVAAIDKALSEQAQGDGLARLRSIVEETGYFTDGRGLYKKQEGDIARGGSSTNVWSIPAEGYTFSHAMTQYGCGGATECLYLLGNLEGWSSIPRERFDKARADYEAIVEQVKEAMKP